jgi:hypothetical protein
MRRTLLVLSLSGCFGSALAATAVFPPAQLQPQGLSWAWAQPHGSAMLRIADANGRVQQFELGTALQWTLPGEPLADGSYRYELTIAPGGALRRRSDDTREREPPQAAGVMQSGMFTIVAGRIEPPSTEPERARSKAAVAKAAVAKAAVAKDVVTADDVIVQGSLCIGFDCVADIDFTGHGLRLAENNTRVVFEDTSVAAGTASSDWELTANDSGSGGANQFSIQNRARGPVARFSAAAATDGFVIAADGRLGIDTATPAHGLHVRTGDNPSIRFDQNNTANWSPYIWELRANETAFALFDVTNGNRRPFAISAGAPTGSVTLATNNRVGFGAPIPAASLHVLRADGTAQVRVEEQHATTEKRVLGELINKGEAALALHGEQAGWKIGGGGGGTAVRITPTTSALPVFTLAASGDLTVTGTLSQGSSRALKHAIENVATRDILERVLQLPVYTWQYRADGDGARHLGPMAEDVFAAFDLGIGERSLAPADVAALALAAAQALRDELAARDAELDALVERLVQLEQAERAP